MVLLGVEDELHLSPTISHTSDFILLRLLHETTYGKTRKPLMFRLQASSKGTKFTLNTSTVNSILNLTEGLWAEAGLVYNNNKWNYAYPTEYLKGN